LHGERGAAAASEAMASATAIGRLRLERRLSFLGTLGNNAPFVGLLGTVIGIVQAFHELERAGLGGSASADIMGAIAEALVATAIGLAVAIPAVAAFNYFQRRIKTTLGNAEALEHIVLSHLAGAPAPAERTSGSSSRERPVRLSLGAVPFETAPIIER
jgi:biopolymer transport protein ExbB